MNDLISKQMAIDTLERKKDKNAKGDVGGFYNKIIQNDIDALMQLPSVQPDFDIDRKINKAYDDGYDQGYLQCKADQEPITGHWIERRKKGSARWQSWCSVCGKHSGIGGIESNRHKPFCPNCGSPMNDEVEWET